MSRGLILQPKPDLITPRSPRETGAAFWFHTGNTDGTSCDGYPISDVLTVSGGDIATAKCYGGANRSMTGTHAAYVTSGAPPTNWRGKRRAFALLQQASRGSKLVGSNLLSSNPNGMPSGPVPWSIVVCARWDATPTTSGSLFWTGFAMIGTTSSGDGIVLNTSNTTSGGTTSGRIGAWALNTSPSADNLYVPFGTETLDDGTAGDTVPLYQVIGLVQTLDRDGKWYLRLYRDGVFIGRFLSGTAGAGITLGTDAFGLMPWAAQGTAPDHAVFDAAWWVKALSDQAMREVSLWCLREIAAPATALKIIGAGASILNSGGASSAALGFFSLLPSVYLGAYGIPILVVNGGVNGCTTTGYESADASSEASATAVPRLDQLVAQLSPRARRNIGFISGDLLSNDNAVAGVRDGGKSTRRGWRALAERLRAAGCDRVVASLATPCDPNVIGSSYETERLADNAYLRAVTDWPGYVVPLIDWEATSDARPNPCTSPVAATLGGACALLVPARFTVTSGTHPDDTGHNIMSQILAGNLGRL